MNELDQALREYAHQLEADFFGVANLAPAYPAILDQGGPEVARYPRSISLGIALLDSIVDQLPRRSERAVAVSYRSHAYEVINQRLDEMASRMGNWLRRRGYDAMPIPAAMRADDERISAIFSHKLAAHLAGLGWIGKSCLLITPEVGPRARWITVLTDAPLVPTGSPMATRCGDCQECANICPVGAIAGRIFREEEPRELRLDARKCENNFKEIEKTGLPPVCGMCLYACPYGQSGA